MKPMVFEALGSSKVEFEGKANECQKFIKQLRIFVSKKC